MKIFSEHVSSKLGNYVYRLVDPRNGETFYIGKGTGNRVFDHAHGALQFENDCEDSTSSKIGRIRDIRNEGLDVLHIIHRHGIPDSAIFEVEAALIDVFPGLSNEQGGHHSYDRGPMNSEQIIKKYGLPIIDDEPEHKLLLINVNNIEDRTSIDAVYKQTQCSWRISVDKARQADYVLSVYRGVVIGVFIADKWVESTPETFPGRDHLGRYGFIGKPAPDEIWELYVGELGKRIENSALKHVQNPIRYWKIDV
jgi:hypothetical protein